MPARRLHTVGNAEPTCSTEANYLVVHSGLRHQEIQRGINIFRHALEITARAAAFAEPTHVQREGVEASRRKLRGHAAPRFAVAVALMQQ
jgi:hypothetical protein